MSNHIELADFITAISNARNSSEVESFYRGHADASYKLLPTIYRGKGKLSKKEHLIIREAILRNPEDFAGKLANFEKLALMQHYSYPTRLLDMTENPLVALYFACAENEKKDGEVVVIKIKRNAIKYFDSDTVSVLSSFSKVEPDCFQQLNEEIKKLILSNKASCLKRVQARLGRNTTQTAITTVTNYLKDSKNKTEQTRLLTECFNQCELVRFLVHEIGGEKPHFTSRIDPSHFNNKIVCVKSKYDNRRILAQMGVFLLFGIKDSDKAQCADFEKSQIEISKIKITASSKKGLLKQLEVIGISEERLFPEIMSSAKVVTRRFS